MISPETSILTSVAPSVSAADRNQQTSEPPRPIVIRVSPGGENSTPHSSGAASGRLAEGPAAVVPESSIISNSTVLLSALFFVRRRTWCLPALRPGGRRQFACQAPAP